MPLDNRFLTGRQELQLRAALLEDEAGRNAAREWLSQMDIGKLDEGSRRLLPLLYRNLKATDPLHPMLPELRKIHLEYWASNHKLFHRTAQILRWIQDQGVPTIVLKGVAVAALHYGDIALRPMADSDVLVPVESAPWLVRRFRENGWEPCWSPEKSIETPYFYRYRNALNMIHPELGDFDLHWHVLSDETSPDADRIFWERAVPLLVKDVETKALCPTHNLFHACIHGAKTNVVTPIRWVADAMIIIRSGPIDWAHLEELANSMRVPHVMYGCLSALRERFDAPVPELTLRRLAESPVSGSERRAYNRLFRLPDDNAWSPWDYVDDMFFHFRLINHREPWWRIPGNFAAHVRLRLGSRSRVVGRARRWFTRQPRLNDT